MKTEHQLQKGTHRIELTIHGYIEVHEGETLTVGEALDHVRENGSLVDWDVDSSD